MTRAWLLLFGLLALGHCQIIYPDQYEIMKAASNSPYPYPSDERILGTSNREPVQDVQQYAAAAQAASGRPLFAASQAPSQQPLSAPSQAAYYPPATITTPVPSPQSLPQDWGTHVNNIIAKGITKFTLDLDKAIYNSKETSAASRNRQNSIFSPLNIGAALSVVLLGSAGRTFDEVSRVLGLETGVDISQHSEIVHQMFGLLLNTVNYRVAEGNGPRVSTASGIFVQEGFPIRPQFQAISQNAYKSEVINLDFRNRGEEAVKTINNWVKQRTMEKISGIISQAPDPQTNVILASALYFNGEWNQHFINSATRRRPFSVEPNESAIEIDMMYNGGSFPFYEDKSLGVKVVQLPYKGLEMSMYVLLPKAEGATALRSFSNQLTTEMIEHLMNNLKNQTCVIGLPRMKLSSSLSLKKALTSLGLRSLFNPHSADLSILSSGYGAQPVAAATGRPYDPLAVLPLVNTQTIRPLASPQAAYRPQTITSNITPRPYTIPQTLPQAISQNMSRTLPQNQQQALSNVLSQAIPQALPQVSSQAMDNDNNNNILIFSRFDPGENDAVTGGVRRNYFRTRRDTDDGRDDDASRLTYVAKEDHGDLRRDNPNTKYVSLEENKYRFREASGEEKRTGRKRRQVARPMDQSFLKFIQSQNFPYYGLDDLRNKGQLTNPGLFADDVLHKVEMEVSERGTEAAASTSVILERDGNQKRLIANRPFLFFIRHDPTGLILFWGTVNTPTPNYSAVR
ncbi:alpha-2-antiplasmin isoform X2 [Harpegnathos saltator]|uniref:alpha-2-antiplasmin isoform X2 n=1 Tax=Harpegnathos saltator TaxID=610380 RepID=UPI00058E1B4D|nr:alpha-2-antiplasmin isoform X2 [Harpegnathos saltator]